MTNKPVQGWFTPEPQPGKLYWMSSSSTALVKEQHTFPVYHEEGPQKVDGVWEKRLLMTIQTGITVMFLENVRHGWFRKILFGETIGIVKDSDVKFYELREEE